MRNDGLLFWDLDETLVHTRVLPASSKLSLPGTEFAICRHLRYFTTPRPDVHGLLGKASEIIPRKRMFILTSSCLDYALETNDVLGLGFAEDHVLSRQALKAAVKNKYKKLPNKLRNPCNLLVDDRDYYDRWTRDKLLLSGVRYGNYYRCKEFDSRETGENYGEENEQILNWIQQRANHFNACLKT